MGLLLKNKVFIFSAIGMLVLFMEQCSNSGEQQSSEIKKDSSSCVKPLNPNGDSELAVLMRDMMSSAKSLKEMVKQGELPKTFPEAFLKIHTAKPTDSETKKASFDGFADNYINNLQELYKSPKGELTQNYNAVVNACVACHSEHCPGPLKAINKLKID